MATVKHNLPQLDDTGNCQTDYCQFIKNSLGEQIIVLKAHITRGIALSYPLQLMS